MDTFQVYVPACSMQCSCENISQSAYVSCAAALWASLLVLIWVFHSVEPLAGYLQLPYLAWVSFASVLNYTLLKLNTKPVRTFTLALGL